MKIVTEISKQIRTLIRRDRKNKRKEVLERRILRTALKDLKETGKEWIPKRKKKGKEVMVTNRKRIQELATDFYKDLYSNRDTQMPPSTQLFRNETTVDQPEWQPHILPSEVEKAIKSQKNGEGTWTG